LRRLVTLGAGFVVGLIALGGGLRAAEPTTEAPPATDAAGLLRAFFAEADAAKRAELAGQFAPLAPKSWDELKALLHRTAPFPAMEPGKHPLKTQGDETVPPVAYVLRIPAGYKADAGQAWPLIINCHGSGGTGEGALASLENLLGPDVDKYLLACPGAPTEGVYKATRVNVEFPLHALDDVRRRVNVDSNRTVLMGVSRGGYTTWGTVLFAPGQWAGAVPLASWPVTEAGSAGAILYLPNVLPLAIQAHWGENDIEPGQKQGINTLSREVDRDFVRLGARQFEGIEYPGQGHNLKPDAEKIRAFLASARRDPCPALFRHIFHHLWQGRAYFVRATAVTKDEFDFDAPHIVKTTGLADLPRAKRELYLKEAFEFTALTKGAENTIAVTAKNISGIEVEVSPEELDFSRPVKVLFNGRLAGEVRKIDYAEMLETARRSYDFERLVGARVKAATPAKK
jgi:pimeloyl-ACP methyl ester carboxylesterase